MVDIHVYTSSLYESFPLCIDIFDCNDIECLTKSSFITELAIFIHDYHSLRVKISAKSFNGGVYCSVVDSI